MNDLISRSALLEDKVFLCGGFVGDEYAKGYMEALDKVEETIKNAPTVEPVRGEWKVKTKLNNGYTVSITCSVCGYSHSRVMYNFCPECGADMRKGGVNNV